MKANSIAKTEPSEKLNREIARFHFWIRVSAIAVALMLIRVSEYQKNIHLFYYGIVVYLIYFIYSQFFFLDRFKTKVIKMHLYIDVLVLSIMIGFRGGLRSDFFLGYFLILGYVLLIRDRFLLIKLSIWITLTFSVAAVFFTEGEFSAGRLVIRLVLLLGTTALLQNYSRMLNAEEVLRLNASRRALTDSLTGVYNRNILQYVDELHLDKETAQFIAMLDLDDFKIINDTYGHQKGDEVLITLGKILNKYIYDDNIALRFGGEEFMIILYKQEWECAEQILETIKKEFSGSKYSWYKVGASISFSVGMVKRKAGETLVASIGRADQLLYDAKNSGKDMILIDEQ